MKIKTLRTDRGCEYLSDQFKSFCDEKGIARQLTIPYTSQQNVVAERRNITLLDMVRSMMAQANLPISFWGDALLNAAYVLNRMPSKSIPFTPYELWNGNKPDLGNLLPWGCAAYIHNNTHQYGKLGPKGKKCIFIRYSETSKGFVFIDEKAYGSMTELESRDVVFLEEDFPVRGKVNKDFQFYENLENGDPTTVEGLEDTLNPPGESGSDIVPDPTPMEQDHEQSQPRRSIRERIPRRRFEIVGEAFMIAPQDDEEPKTITEALSGPKAKELSKAMEEEMKSMRTNQVWDLVDLPPGRKSIGNKWILKIKRKSDGSIERYKAQLVAKGYTQEEGIDYEDTFSPVVRITSVRLVLAIISHMDLELYQMDVKTAFLNGELDEEIYMDQPLGFESK